MWSDAILSSNLRLEDRAGEPTLKQAVELAKKVRVGDKLRTRTGERIATVTGSGDDELGPYWTVSGGGPFTTVHHSLFGSVWKPIR